MPDAGDPSQIDAVPMTSTADITIRRADARDADSITRLAALDSTRAPAGRVLLAEVDGEPWAAISADDGHVAADPFRPSAPSAQLLRTHLRVVEPTGRTGAIRRRLHLFQGPRAA